MPVSKNHDKALKAVSTLSAVVIRHSLLVVTSGYTRSVVV